MTTTYNWTIVQLDRNLPDNGVVTAHYNVSATDGDFNASTYGTCSFTPDPDSPSYTPYDELTQEQVVGWVQESLGKDTVEASLAGQIEAQQHPTQATGVPW